MRQDRQHGHQRDGGLRKVAPTAHSVRTRVVSPFMASVCAPHGRNPGPGPRDRPYSARCPSGQFVAVLARRSLDPEAAGFLVVEVLGRKSDVASAILPSLERPQKVATDLRALCFLCGTLVADDGGLAGRPRRGFPPSGAGATGQAGWQPRSLLLRERCSWSLSPADS